MAENSWYKLKDKFQPAIDFNNPTGVVGTELYDELMSLKTELSNTEKILIGEINLLKYENKKLSDEIASIKQLIYYL